MLRRVRTEIRHFSESAFTKFCIFCKNAKLHTTTLKRISQTSSEINVSEANKDLVENCNPCCKEGRLKLRLSQRRCNMSSLSKFFSRLFFFCLFLFFSLLGVELPEDRASFLPALSISTLIYSIKLCILRIPVAPLSLKLPSHMVPEPGNRCDAGPPLSIADCILSRWEPQENSF